MVEQVVGLEFVTSGEREIVSSIARVDSAQKKLQATSNALAQAQKRNAGSEEAVIKAYLALERSGLSYSDVLSGLRQDSQMAQKSAQQYNNALLGVDKAHKSAKSSADVFRAAMKANETALEQQAAETKQAAAADAALAREKDRLIQKLNPLRSASMLYEKELRDINEATRLGAINDLQRQQSLDALNAEFQAFSTGAQGAAMANNRFGVQSQMAARKTNQLGVLMQQTGYQVGDFAVQVQGGTNVMVALGQQATQLVGTFGMLAKSTRMIGVFAGLGVLIPILTGVGAYFLRMRDSANEAAKAADKLDDKISSLKDSLVDYTNAQAALTSGVSLDEYFAIQDLDKVSDELKKAKDDLASLTVSEGLVGGVLGALPFIGDNVGVQAEIAAYNAAIERVKAAEEVLAGVRAKQADERLASFDKERIALEDQLAMAEGIAKFGEDSAQVARLALEQRIAAFDRNIDQQVTANKLTVDQGNALKAVNAEIANTEFATEEIERNQDALTEGAKSLLGVWSAITGRVKESASEIANATKALDDMRIEFSFRGRSMAQYGGRGTTSDRPISGDIPEEPTVIRSSSGGASNVVDINAILDARRQQIEQERVLLGLSGQQREAQTIYFDLLKQNEEAVNRLTDTELMRAANVLAAEQEKNRVIEEGLKRQQDISKLLESSMERAFMSIVDGTATVQDAFKAMASEIIKELYRVLVVQQIVGSASGGTGIAGFISGFFANGAAFNNGNVVPFANGGVVGSPTTFPMAGGKTGLMGEAGPEAIMPLKRGKDGKLGVAADGGGAVTVNNYFTVQANGDDSVKRIVRQQIPQIAEATKAAVVDAKRRGGSYGRAFG
jgi:hypothetical protein